MNMPELIQTLKASGATADLSDINLLGRGLWGDVYDLADDTVLKLVRGEAGIGNGLDLWQAECAALDALEDIELPVRVPELIDSDRFGARSPAGEAGFVAWMRLEKVPGTPLDNDLLEGLPQAERERLAQDLAETLAVLHGLDGKLKVPDRQGEADLNDLDAIAEATRDVADPRLIEAIRRSGEALPGDPATVPCHGDVNTTNLLIDFEGRLTGLIDWAEARRDWREAEMCHLALIPIFFPVFAEAYESVTGLILDEERLNLAAWHNVLISLAIARKTANREEEARALQDARRLPDLFG
jgi:Ser/Thr protein kinase RdoA (MazF antagonist)